MLARGATLPGSVHPNGSQDPSYPCLKRHIGTDVAVARALELFWKQGYEATSMADPVEHLSIGRASLYNTFGSKHELYLKALDRYLLESDPSPLEFLSRPGPALPLVRALVERCAQDAACDVKRRGCMVVNAVSPGWVDTDMSLLPGESRSERDARLKGAIPAGRIAHPAEVAAPVLWLASDDARFIVGHDLVVDGAASL